jgi:anti-anti-sigma factor
MIIDTQTEGSRARLVLNGRFDFNSHMMFNQTTDSLLREAGIKELELDFDQVKYIDSSAMGMLLLLKERAKGASKSITLLNCKGSVAQVFELSNFRRLFTIK